MKFLSLLMLVSLFCTLNLYSRENSDKYRLFVEFGMMNSTITNRYKAISNWGNISNEEKSKSSPIAGIGAEYKLSEYLSLQSGLNLSSLESKTTIFNSDETAVNWQEVPRRYDTETAYQMIGLPLGLKFKFVQLNRLKAFINSGVQVNSLLDYKSTTLETYYDASTRFFDTSFEKEEFSMFNLSVFGSLGTEYDISKKMYLGISVFYDHMFDKIEGRETFLGNHYTVKIDDLGARIKLGYIL